MLKIVFFNRYDTLIEIKYNNRKKEEIMFLLNWELDILFQIKLL